jgi:hypothetical protein
MCSAKNKTQHAFSCRLNMTRRPKLLKDLTVLNWGVGCKGTTFNVMPLMYLETELPENPPLVFGYNICRKSMLARNL